MRRMEALMKVISQIHKQWGIDCKAKDFTLAVTRLLQLSIIDRPVEILHPDIWDQCTKVLAEETMSSGSAKYLKSWGRVVQILKSALQEQETWKATQNCLKFTLQLGVGAATQTVLEETFSEETFKGDYQTVEKCDLAVSDCVQAADKVGSANCRNLEEQNLPPKASIPELAAEEKNQAKLFYDRLTEEARNIAKNSAGGSLVEGAEGRPPPYTARDCSESLGENKNVSRLECLADSQEAANKEPPFYEDVALDVPFKYSAADNPHNFLIVPRVLYHQEEEMYRFLEETIQLHKREVMTGITIAMLLGLGAASTATGVSALETQHQGLSQLQMTIDEDLLRIEKSISSLEESISSLSEVVLQNRQGLDLLLMHQGDLCAALREECCFYADHTGVVRDSMAELRERLAQRKREREAQQGWFESWYNQSPWLATLVSTLIGLLTMILLVLIFGPCILNKLVLFVRSCLEKVNILFVECLQLP
ncbi:hypothetical protein DUI87_04888 [Hirundo rustica rustica]|uniref:Retroviral Gag polyprotein M domain-containing protein n=1 Tax=Hirundo rustica rustica TaxID=333673 RepID=A0A3M0KXJ4_HIRRU|nr:hypothetical protein DUI87_04888 [Hirundo rustica rustica]